MIQPTKNRIVCFGEILWDILPDGAMPGGAPMNVAYHLSKMGLTPQLITRVGHDEWGKALIQLMEKNNISTDYFQMDHKLSTGKVIATPVDRNNVSYEIVNPSAWDHIEWEDSFENLLSESEQFIFGSLAARNATSRNTLFQLLELTSAKIFDINLRPPFYNKDILHDLLRRTDLLKLNNAELELITGWFNFYKSEDDRIQVLQDRFNIPTIVVTKGENGSSVLCNGKIFRHPGFSVSVADTIGSGDAFLAGFVTEILAGNSIETAVERANAMGALIASYKGACPEYDINEVQSLPQKTQEASNLHI